VSRGVGTVSRGVGTVSRGSGTVSRGSGTVSRGIGLFGGAAWRPSAQTSGWDDRNVLVDHEAEFAGVGAGGATRDGEFDHQADDEGIVIGELLSHKGLNDTPYGRPTRRWPVGCLWVGRSLGVFGVLVIIY
jgi:hypothetical protein